MFFFFLKKNLFYLEKNQEVVEVIKSWREDDNASKAYDLMRNKFSFEGFLLKGIAQFG